ncbi:MFS transporter [Yinghuangia seranimata]|uniref:MFS transporter n=1 Tax=Yinghuangia seranimata TaxID=408067 RepID=UPI00248B8EC7|nr:MFS transporter [Yinghuangia seranimata]MDI2125557.1 MFS transporter [Yinghuangia seranimata]
MHSTTALTAASPASGTSARGGDAAPRAAKAFAVLAAVQAVLNTAVAVTAGIGPDLQRDLGLGNAGLVWTNAAYTLAFSGLLLLGGRLADIYGRVRMFAVGTGGFAFASLVVAAAPSGEALIGARLAQGVGSAIAAPAAMALVGDVFRDEGSRGKAMAAWGGLSGIGAALGMQLAGLTASASWRWAFVVIAVIGAAAAVLGRRLLPDTHARRAGARLDVLGAVLATGTLALIGYALTEVGARGWTSPVVLGAAAAGIALGAAFVAVERAVAAPLLPMDFVASRQRAVALGTGMLAPIAGASSAFLLSLYFQKALGWTALRSAMAFVPYTLVLIAAGASAATAVAKLGIHRAAPLGLLVNAAAFLLLGFVTSESSYVGLPLAGLLMLPVGISLTAASAVIGATRGVPQSQAALAGGVFNTFMLMGPTIGIALFASLADSHAGTGASGAADGYAFAFRAASVLFLVVAVLTAVGLRERRRG